MIVSDIAADPAGALWSTGAAGYEEISFGLGDGILYAIQSLDPAPGAPVLEIGTGTGWGARHLAERGAQVTAIDIAPGMLDTARRNAAHLDIDFRRAPAEALPFADAGFAAVLSTYGIIFTAQPDQAIAELARVTLPGGRIAMTTWADEPGGYIASFFGLIGRHTGAPPPDPSPLDWGRQSWLDKRLSPHFDLHVAPFETVFYATSAEAVWENYHNGFPPVRAAAEAMTPRELAAFREDFLDLHRPFAEGHGLRIPRAAMLVTGRRR